MQKSKKVSYRHFAITELINSYSVENQQQLLDLLKSDFQIETTQSILSRDLVDLGVVKQHYKDKVVYEMPDTSASRETVRLGVHSVVYNETLVIVNTVRGFAPFIADYLDQKEDPGILGTLAGETAIFVAPTSVKNIHAVYENVCRALFYKFEESTTQETQTAAEPKSAPFRLRSGFDGQVDTTCFAKGFASHSRRRQGYGAQAGRPRNRSRREKI